jgi:hypothetical protein
MKTRFRVKATATRLRTICIAVLLFGAVEVEAQIHVRAIVNGVDSEIGFLEPTISDGDAAEDKFERATFDLHPDFGFLMNDQLGCQFRFFQIVTSDSDPMRPPMVNGILPNIPYVDPPSGGYQGQTSAMGNGADTSPFYENDDGAGPYAFQRYSDFFNEADSAFPVNTPVHDPVNGIVNTNDFPDVSDNSRVDFETYIVFVDETLRAQKTFDVRNPCHTNPCFIRVYPRLGSIIPATSTVGFNGRCGKIPGLTLVSIETIISSK